MKDVHLHSNKNVAKTVQVHVFFTLTYIILFLLTLAARLSAGTRFMTGASCAELRILLCM